MEKRPVVISEFYLSAYLAQLKLDGYSIFIIEDGNLPPPLRDMWVDETGAMAKRWHLLDSIVKPRSASGSGGGSTAAMTGKGNRLGSR
jgi:hypothetical protein